eukprot:7218811-Karenia_brevis.AAC.1
MKSIQRDLEGAAAARAKEASSRWSALSPEGKMKFQQDAEERRAAYKASLTKPGKMSTAKSSAEE